MISLSDICMSLVDEQRRLGLSGLSEHASLLSRLYYRNLRSRRERTPVSPRMSRILKTYGGTLAILPAFRKKPNLDSILTVSRVARRVFGFDVRILRPVVPELLKFETEHGGFYSYIDGDAIIPKLAESPEYETYGRVLVVTDTSVWTDRFKWVYGYAGLRIPVGIVSTGEIQTNRHEGLHKIVIHEIGHTFGVPHCPDENCVMENTPGRGVNQIPLEFCDVCIGQILAGTFRKQA